MNILDLIVDAQRQVAANQEARNVMELPVVVPHWIYKLWIDSWAEEK